MLPQLSADDSRIRAPIESRSADTVTPIQQTGAGRGPHVEATVEPTLISRGLSPTYPLGAHTNREANLHLRGVFSKNWLQNIEILCCRL